MTNKVLASGFIFFLWGWRCMPNAVWFVKSWIIFITMWFICCYRITQSFVLLCCPFIGNKLLFPLVLFLFSFPPDQFLAIDTDDPVIPCDFSSLTSTIWSLDHATYREFSLARNLDALRYSKCFIWKVILILHELFFWFSLGFILNSFQFIFKFHTT